MSFVFLSLALGFHKRALRFQLMELTGAPGASVSSGGPTITLHLYASRSVGGFGCFLFAERKLLEKK